MTHLSPNVEGGEAARLAPWGMEPGRLWSLWDMINWSVRRLCELLSDLREEELRFFCRDDGHDKIALSEDDLASLNRIIGLATQVGIHIEADDLIVRVSRLQEKVSGWVSWNDYSAEFRFLRETIEGHLQGILLYKYPREKGRLVIGTRSTWQKAILSFPSIEMEVVAGVDCYAVGHNTACVFHMMRASEAGLRALARERKVRTVRNKTPIDYGTWNDVIKAIDGALSVIKQKTADPKKDTALAFYNRATSDLRSLQDLYRDRTMHLRDSYDDGQAQSAMFRVRDLLDMLADKGISEHSAKTIRWGIR